MIIIRLECRVTKRKIVILAVVIILSRSRLSSLWEVDGGSTIVIEGRKKKKKKELRRSDGSRNDK